MVVCWFFFFQAEDGIRDLVRSRGLGDVYKRQEVGVGVGVGVGTGFVPWFKVISILTGVAETSTVTLEVLSLIHI